MPLSKAKNRERMKEIRLHKRSSSPQDIKPVQPKIAFIGACKPRQWLDADGNPVYEEG